jgi:hypothetical protein
MQNHMAAATMRLYIVSVLFAGTYAFKGCMFTPKLASHSLARPEMNVRYASQGLTLRKKTSFSMLKMTDSDTARDELINKMISAAPYDLPSLVSQVASFHADLECMKTLFYNCFTESQGGLTAGYVLENSRFERRDIRRRAQKQAFCFGR